MEDEKKCIWRYTKRKEEENLRGRKTMEEVDIHVDCELSD